jgi:UDP-N-acetyl-D-mannosaminuronate dehydrogenase
VRTELGRNFRFVELANDVNEHMPDHVVQRTMHLLNDEGKALKGSNVLLVGVAYKKDSGDSRESPALRIIELLGQYGARVLGVDSHVEDHRWPAGAERVELTPDTLAEADVVIVVTDHSDIDLSLLVDAPLPVFDTRNSVQGSNIHRL